MVSQVSCKLINTLLNDAEKHGVSLTSLLELFDGPEEFLRDPHFWLEIGQAERLFTRAARLVGDPNYGFSCGSRVVELQSFGALDNVFKMMPSKKDYYNNLSRFFSYFVAPMPEFRELEHGETWVRFKMPFVGAEFPHVTGFLRACLENLPRYTGHPAAQSEWNAEGNELFITWDSHQASLFDEEPGQVLNPKLIQSLSAQLEASERALHQKNREVMALRAEVDQIRFELQTSQRERIYTEKMAGLAHLAAGVAHEINNPLSFVMSNLVRFDEYFQQLKKYIEVRGREKGAEALRKELDIDFILSETPAMLKDASEGLKRVKEIVKDLSALAHPQEGRTESKILTDVNRILESSLKVFQNDVNERIHIEKSLNLGKPVKVFPVRISQVFMNLLSNAIHAVDAKGGHGTIEVKTSEHDDTAVIEIADTGVGMDEHVKSRIFTPFFTTKEVGRGTGLGLSIAQSIIEMHRGHIDVVSQKGEGSRFIITLPLSETAV